MNERSASALHATRSAAEPDLVVESATGVEVALPVAGAGARSYAFVVDWHIRVVLFSAWYLGASMIYNGSFSFAPPAETTPGWFGFVLLPGLAIYFLYHPILEIAMRGRTPGKRMAGVRLVTRDGAVPTVTALLIRNVFRLIDAFPVCYALGLVCVALTKDHRRIGDLAAGTLLVYEPREHDAVLDDLSSAALSKRLDPATAELVAELLQRWPTLDSQVRQNLARALVARVRGVAPDGITLNERALHAELDQLTRGGEQ